MMEDTLARLQISDSGFVFDAHTGNTYSLNATGMKVVAFLKEGQTPDGIAASLSQEFGLEPVDTRRDVDDFIVALRDHGLYRA